MAESKDELQSLLASAKEESEKADLKRNIQKSKIMASGRNTSRQIDRGKWKQLTDFILGGSQITVDPDCCNEINRHFSLEEKVWQT